MFRKLNQFSIVILALIVGWGCSTGSEQKQAHISGNFKVLDTIDNSNDFSGVGFTIFKKDSAGADADTLFHTISDSNGTFSGIAKFEKKRQYPVLVSRN